MDQAAVLHEIDGPLARITLNRPDVLNAMNMSWVHDLNVALNAVAADHGVRVVLIRGAGRAFCAGIELDMLGSQGMPPEFYPGQEWAFHHIETMDKTVIAALHGYCLGGGLQLAISCDIRVCSSDCLLGLPAVLEGLFPGMAPFRLPRLIGLGPARRLILSGETIKPDEALHLGLVDYVVPADDFEVGLDRIVEKFLAAPLAASIGSKRLLTMAFDAPFKDVYKASLPLLEDCLASPEVAEAGEAWRRRRTDRAK